MAGARINTNHGVVINMPMVPITINMPMGPIANNMGPITNNIVVNVTVDVEVDVNVINPAPDDNQINHFNPAPADNQVNHPLRPQPALRRLATIPVPVLLRWVIENMERNRHGDRAPADDSDMLEEPEEDDDAATLVWGLDDVDWEMLEEHEEEPPAVDPEELD